VILHKIRFDIAPVKVDKHNVQTKQTYPVDKSRFGGSLLKGNPKVRRPYNSGAALHVVLRSSRAKGPLSLHRRYKAIRALICKQADTFGVRLYRVANSGNHIHLLLRPSADRKEFANFMRAISGLIARLILKAERGAKKGIKFWDARPFSRVVNWGKAFQICVHYVEKNILEALGFDELADEQVFWRARVKAGN
jgi:REP element-mobilizing transposase RayT